MRHALLTVGLLTASPAFAQSVPLASTGQPAPSTAPAVAAPASPVRAAAPPGIRRVAPRSRAELRVRQANVQATREPAASGFVNAVQVYPYNEGALYRLYAAPERVTDIALQPGEAIISVAAGDTVRWTVGDTTSGTGDTKRVHILVKPFAAGLSTNLIITTDKRAYHVQLESNAATAMAALSWTYPQEALIAIRRERAAAEAAMPVASNLSIENLNFNYVVSGDRPGWRPLRAFDDGRQTFIEFPASIAVGEAPPLFLVGDQNETQLVNYRVAGRFYVVDRLFGAAELRLGGRKQAIVRISRATAGRPRRRAS